MKKSFLLSLILPAALTLCAGASGMPEMIPEKSTLVFHGRVMPEKVSFAPGETMNFTFTLKPGEFAGDGCKVSWERTGDDGKKNSGVIPFKEGKAAVPVSMGKPGFIHLRAWLVNSEGKRVSRQTAKGKLPVAFDGGAGVEIDSLRQAVPEPEDFDAFWAKQKARLKSVPMKVEFHELKKTEKYTVGWVSVSCPGPRPMTAYVCIPKVKPKSAPIRVSVLGYNSKAQGGIGCSDSAILMTINAHGFELKRESEYYEKFAKAAMSNGKIYAFDPVQNSDPEKAYFNGMVLRLLRGLEYAKSLPEWDGKNLIVSGGSQGGLQTVWAAGLDPDVSEAAPAITWCCDLAGSTIGRLRGWYPAWVPALGYYDAVNHAKRIRCKTTIRRAGLGDYTCPPSGLAVLYNVMTAPKKIFWYQNSRHGDIPEENKQIFTVCSPSYK